VICFEVLIHQETVEAYRALIDFLALPQVLVK
jgi:hypothetical protein